MNIEISDQFKNDFKLKEGENPLPLMLQEFVFLKLANKEQNIQYELPAFNILAACSSNDQTESSIISKFKESQENQDVFKIRTHTLFPICLSRSRQIDDTYSKTVVNKKISVHMDNKRKKDQCFYNRVYKSDIDKTVDGEISASSSVSSVSSVSPCTPTPPSTPTNVAPLPSTTPTNNLNFAVVVILDLGSTEIKMESSNIISNLLKRDEVKEPVMSVLALFENQDQAESYCKHTASHQYPFCDVFIVETKKWCSPYVMNKDGIKEIYRNSRLDEIMSVRKEELEKVEAFEREQQLMGNEVNEIVIDNVITQEST